MPKQSNSNIQNKNHGGVYDNYGLYNESSRRRGQKEGDKQIKNENKKRKRLYAVAQRSDSAIRNINDYMHKDQNLGKYTFLKRYQLLPNKQKSFRLWGRNFSTSNQSTLCLEKVNYKKLKQPGNNHNKNDKQIIVQFRRQKLETEQNSDIKEANSIQRDVKEPSFQTKLTRQSSSARALSQAINPVMKQSRQSQISKKRSRQYGLPSRILQQNNLQSDILPEKNLHNAIPEEYESSHSKTCKNQSSINLNNDQLKERNSIKSLSINLSKSIKSIKSLQSLESLKSSIKNSLYLPVNSVIKSIRLSSNPQDSLEIEQLEGIMIVSNYMKNLSVVAAYSHEITKNYENNQDWQELIFLTYKKYYLYRLKLFNALFYRNTLFFQTPTQKLTPQDRKSLKKFMNSQNGEALKKQIFKQNISIGDSLRTIYNIVIQKSGNFINMIQTDNFSCQIFRLMTEQIESLKQNYYHEPEIVKTRFKQILKCMIAITRLDVKVDEQENLMTLAEGVVSMDLFNRVIQFVKEKLI